MNSRFDQLAEAHRERYARYREALERQEAPPFDRPAERASPLDADTHERLQAVWTEADAALRAEEADLLVGWWEARLGSGAWSEPLARLPQAAAAFDRWRSEVWVGWEERHRSAEAGRAWWGWRDAEFRARPARRAAARARAAAAKASQAQDLRLRRLESLWAAAQALLAFGQARAAAHSALAGAWHLREQELRKPVLTLYKALLEAAEAPADSYTSALLESFASRIGTDVVGTLAGRRPVLFEQTGADQLVTALGAAATALPGSVLTAADPDGFPLREAFESILIHGPFKRIRESSERMNRLYHRLMTEAETLHDTMAVLKDTAFHSAEEERERLIREGLHRVAERCQTLAETYRVKLDALLDELEEATDQPFQRAQACIEARDFGPLNRLRQEGQLRTQALDWKTRADVLWSRTADAVLVRYRDGRDKAAETTLPLRKWLGFVKEDGKPAHRTRTADFLAETEARMGDLPLIYRRLFSFGPITDLRYLKGRQEELDLIRSATDRWRSGRYSTVAVVGEAGSGKTSLLDAARIRDEQGTERVRLQVEDPVTAWPGLAQVLAPLTEGTPASDPEALVQTLMALEPRIIELEGLERLYLREPGGFEALRRFGDLMARTGTRHLWVVTASRYGWNYLEAVVGVAGLFTTIVETDTMSAEELREAVMTRHRVSGYVAVFTPDASMARSRAYRKVLDDEAARQDLLETAYFAKLAEWAKGNVSIALLFWLRSIRDVHADRFTIQPMSSQPVELGDDCTPEETYLLTAIFQHLKVDLAHLARTQSTTEADARWWLNRLAVRGWVVEREGRYRVNPTLQRPLQRLLHTRNLLH